MTHNEPTQAIEMITLPDSIRNTAFGSQHHFSQIKGKERQYFLVERLWRITANMPIFEVEIEALRLDENIWFNDRTWTEPTVRQVVRHMKLIESANLIYPVILGTSGNVMDGYHRIAKAMLLGHRTIDCVRFQTDPEPDVVECLTTHEFRCVEASEDALRPLKNEIDQEPLTQAAQ